LDGPAARISSEKKLRAPKSYVTINFDDFFIRHGVFYILGLLVLLSDVTALLFNVTNDFHLGGGVEADTLFNKKPLQPFI
jgi:hypothetical protein